MASTIFCSAAATAASAAARCARAASISCRRGPATSLSTCARAAATALLGDLLAGGGVVPRLLGRGAPFGEPGQSIEIAARGVELGLGLGELVLGPPQVFGAASGEEEPELSVGGLGVGACLGEVVLGVDRLEPGDDVAGD